MRAEIKDKTPQHPYKLYQNSFVLHLILQCSNSSMVLRLTLAMSAVRTAIMLRPCYEMSGTDAEYAATRTGSAAREGGVPGGVSIGQTPGKALRAEKSQLRADTAESKIRNHSFGTLCTGAALFVFDFALARVLKRASRSAPLYQARA